METIEMKSERLLEVVQRSDEIDSLNRKRGNSLLKGWELSTLLIDLVDQDETLKQITEKARRATGKQMLDIVGVIEPTDETIETWAHAHKEHSLLSLDNELENITERILNDSLVVLLSPHGKRVIEWYEADKRAIERRKEYEAIPREVWTRANYASNRGAMTSSAARWVAKIDYNGDLGGGQPKNPLRIGGK